MQIAEGKTQTKTNNSASKWFFTTSYFGSDRRSRQSPANPLLKPHNHKFRKAIFCERKIVKKILTHQFKHNWAVT